MEQEMTGTSSQISHRGHGEAVVSQTCVLAPSVRLQLIKSKQVGQRQAPGLATGKSLLRTGSAQQNMGVKEKTECLNTGSK